MLVKVSTLGVQLFIPIMVSCSWHDFGTRGIFL
jgi:hypothetical protein